MTITQTFKIIETRNFAVAANLYGDKNASKLAIVIIGRGETKDYQDYISHSVQLAELGYYTICFDPPGIWESQGGLSEYTITNYVKTIGEIIEQFGSKETLLFGHSMGGLAALIAAEKYEEVTEFIVCATSYTYQTKYEGLREAGIFQDWLDNGRTFTRVNPKSGNTVNICLPGGYFIDAEKYNMLSFLMNSKKRKYFIKLTKDSNSKNELIDEAFKLSANPKKIFEVNGEHNYRDDANAIKRINEVIIEIVKSTD